MIDFDLNISKEGSNLRPASKHNSLSCIDSRYNAVRRCLSTKSTVLACSKHLYCRTIYSYNLIWIGSIYYNVGDNISKSIMDIYGNDYTLHTSGYVIFTIKYTFPHNVNTLQISRKSNKTDILPLHVRVANWDRIFGRFLLRQYIRDVLAETGNSGGAGWDRIFRRCWLRQDIREVLAETGSRSLYSLVMRIQIMCTVHWWWSNNTPPEYPVSVLAHQATPCSWANYRKGVCLIHW